MKNRMMENLIKLGTILAISLTAVAISLLVISLSFPKAKAGDGVLPLGDGTLPLRMQGFAQEMGVADDTGSQVTANIVLTAVARGEANSGVQTCSQVGSSALMFKAGGQISVGTQAFSISGICYDDSTRRVEIQATQTQTRKAASLTGIWSIANSAPHLKGRLSDGGSPMVHYQVQVQK